MLSSDPTWCPPFLFPVKVVLGFQDFNGWYNFLCGNRHHGDMLHPIALFDNLGVSPHRHEQEHPSSVDSPPNDSADGESSTSVPTDERRAP